MSSLTLGVTRQLLLPFSSELQIHSLHSIPDPRVCWSTPIRALARVILPSVCILGWLLRVLLLLTRAGTGCWLRLAKLLWCTGCLSINPHFWAQHCTL